MANRIRLSALLPADFTLFRRNADVFVPIGQWNTPR